MYLNFVIMDCFERLQ